MFKGIDPAKNVKFAILFFIFAENGSLLARGGESFLL